MAETPAQQQYPNLNPYTGSNGSSQGSLQNAKDSIVNITSSSSSDTASSLPNTPAAASSTLESVKNSQTVQQLSSGPMAEKARAEHAQTKSEFSNLAASRQTPDSTTATGQNLTHYHSFFYNLLSWENPRATALSYATIVLFIFATRYLPIARYVLKGTYITLGIMAAVELAGKLVLGQGVASKMRPQRYYTLPRETLESIMEDLTELVNFFVIEVQRILFAENVAVTIGAFATTLLTYLLIKITPTWGLALLFTTLAYFVPLAYIQNRELIDEHLANASDIISKQTAQVQALASEHTNKALGASQSAFKDYSARASELVGGAKKSAVEKGVISHETATQLPGEPVKKEDFPAAPKTEPAATAGATSETTPAATAEPTPA